MDMAYDKMSDAEYKEHEMDMLEKISYNTSMNKENGMGISDQSTLADFGALGGVGYYGGGRGFADFSSNAVRTECNSRLLDRNSLENFRGQDIILENQNALAVQSRFLEVDNKIDRLAMQHAECCCDLKQQIAQSEARLNSKIDAVTIANLERDLQECRTQQCSDNNTVKIINAINAGA